MKQIYWIRHGWQGDALYNVDIPLTEAGRRQAEVTGAWMEQWGVARLFSSHLLRARETAEILNTYLKVPYEIRPAIEEIHYGVFTGQTPQWAREHYPEYFRLREAETEDAAYPEGENAAMVLERIQPFLEELKRCPEEQIAVVSHGNVIRTLTAWLLGLPPQYRFRLGREMENCGITEVDWDEETDRFLLQSFNGTEQFRTHPELRRSAVKSRT